MGKYDHIDFNKEIPFIRKRCSHLTDKEIEEAEENFRDYIRLWLEIYEDKKILEEEEI